MKKLAILIAISLYVTLGQCQPTCPPNTPGNPIPLDSSIIILIIAGAIMGGVIAYRQYKLKTVGSSFH